MIRGLLWRPMRLVSARRVDNVPLRHPVGVKALQGQRISRAPSWSWLALEGPIILGTGVQSYQRLGNKSNHQCQPILPPRDGKETWSPDEWGPKDIQQPFRPCTLKMRGFLREVRCSTQPTSSYGRKPQWHYSRAKLNRIAVLLEAPSPEGLEEGGGTSVSGRDQSVVAMGVFDVEEGSPSRLWALRLVVDEGLLLARTEEEHFRRLGIFKVEDDKYFDHPALDELTLV